LAGKLLQSRGWFALGVVAILVAALLNPLSAFADTDLVIGGQARISYANGDDVRLREEPGFSGTLIRYLPEGTVLDVVDGPFEDDDGNLWYQLTFEGDTGFIVSDYLALDSGAAPVSNNAGPGTVIGSALVSGTNNDGVRCRTEPSTGGAVISVVPEGAIIDLIGAADGGWQPINCAGRAGYVSTDYVSYDFSAGADFGAQAVTGSATVAGTNGDGVNCRTSATTSSAVITTIADGSVLSLRGEAQGGWQPVVCAGSNGYVSTDFVSFDGGAGDEDLAVGAEATGSMVVTGTNGDGVRCRTRASLDGSIIAVLPEDSVVSTRGSEKGGWVPIICAGTNGWASAQYLSATGGGGGGGGDGTTAVVTGTGGGLRCRDEAGYNGTVLTVISDGIELELRGGVQGDWQPVVCQGQNGFVFSGYLDSDGSGAADDGDSGGDSNSSFSAGDSAVVSGTNGDGVRLRSSASLNGAIVMVVSEGQGVSVISGSTGDWVAVSYRGTSGFIHMDYLAAGSGDRDDDDDGGSGGLSVGDHARVTSDLNLRYDPSTSAGIAAVAPTGTVVAVTGGVSNGFYAVDWDGLSGYMHSDYLALTDRALTDRGGSGDNDDSGDDDDGGDGGSGSRTGNSIVDYAMQYLGYPYVWATHGPSSFDCSGFTYWVILNTLGVNISPGTSAQINHGTPVSRNSLQPGDLVFFQNTYTWGLSHVGIYIGGGKFIHAQNEATGVVISELSSTYYSSRWYGARRIA
jgi:cell wall-associated NlpC family hydrolase/SH3-like domain-containing protein